MLRMRLRRTFISFTVSRRVAQKTVRKRLQTVECSKAKDEGVSLDAKFSSAGCQSLTEIYRVL